MRTTDRAYDTRKRELLPRMLRWLEACALLRNSRAQRTRDLRSSPLKFLFRLVAGPENQCHLVLIQAHLGWEKIARLLAALSRKNDATNGGIAGQGARSIHGSEHFWEK